MSDGVELRGHPRLVGTTKGLYSCSIDDTQKAESQFTVSNVVEVETAGWPAINKASNYFKSAQWSADGTTLLTSSADNRLRTFILPPDLLAEPVAHILRPYASHTLPSPAYALAIHPAYDLLNPSTALYISSPSSLPIRLISPFVPGILASYPLINQTTEAFIAPHSIIFDTHSGNGNHFFAGSESEISIFDINRNGDGPMSRMKTIPSRRKKIVGGGVGMKGIVSALAMSPGGILVAGTFGRWVGFYGSGGRGAMEGVFEVGNEIGGGAGITQLLWSSCGRYLCIVERGSDGIGVWDVRNTGKKVGWLRGQKGMTMQRLGAEILDNELWCGGSDGVVRVWEIGPEGMCDPVWTFKAHDDAVSSTAMHKSGSVLATCSGQRVQESQVREGGPPLYDNRLNVWAI